MTAPDENPIIAGAKEALEFAKGEKPAARIHINGIAYVPESVRADLVPRVKALEWDDHPLADGPVISKAETIMGTYFICDDTDDFSGLYCELISHKKALWWGDVKADRTTIIDCQHVDDHSTLQAAAQAHYNALILGALDTDTEGA